MATKKTVKKLPFFDFSSWNFIIYLLLGFVLIVVVATMLQSNAMQLGVQAGFACPELKVPANADQCRGGFVVAPNGNCKELVCKYW